MEETQKATGEREAPKGARLPWISTIEPTGFWGACALLWGLGTLACAVVVAVAAREGVGHLRQIQMILGK